VLASPRGFISLELSIDEFIPDGSFFTRSQPGEHQLTKDDYADFATQAPPTSSILPSMRASASSRDVLTYTGARFLVRFEYLDQFPGLDITLGMATANYNASPAASSTIC
jgi:hypothetical protein